MDKRSSPITDLYGTASQGGVPKRGGHTWLWVLLILVGFFVFQSLRAEMRLRSDPPASVVGARLNSTDAEYRSQVRMARACWDYAIHSLQDNYPYGQSLPRRPPHSASNSVGKATPISVQCWTRLRSAWTRRESWVEKYEWDTSWISNPKSSFRETVQNAIDFLRNLG